jgi:hypothetical protein
MEVTLRRYPALVFQLYGYIEGKDEDEIKDKIIKFLKERYDVDITGCELIFRKCLKYGEGMWYINVAVIEKSFKTEEVEL